MKPEFALSLSFDGIRLLHRAAGGWRELGAVDIATEDLARDLRKLRKLAVQNKTKRVRTKLILPDDQIKYLTIDTDDLDDDARTEAARAALEGATPYPVDALAFDISAEGPKTHIAAVARETLAEAEAFAVEHRFNPVSFVAAPEDCGFLGEPFFGQTACATDLLARGATVEPDGIRVVVVSHEAETVLEDETSEADGREETIDAQEAATQKQADPPASATIPKAPPFEDTSLETETVPETVEATPEESKAVKADIDPQADVPKLSQDEPATEALSADTPAEETPAGDKPETDTLDDKTIEDHAPKTDVSAEDVDQKEDLQGADVAAPQIPPEDVSPLMGFATRRRADADGSAAATSLGGVTREPPKKRPAARLTIADRVPDAGNAPPLSPQQTAVNSLRAAPPIEDLPPEPAPAEAATATPNPKGNFLSRRKAKRVPPAPPEVSSSIQRSGRAARVSAPAPVAANPPDVEAERMTVFGARAEAHIGGKPRFLGLILTALLLVFLAGVAAWASVFLDDGLAKLFPKRERTLASTLPADVEDALAEDVGATLELEPTEQSGDALIVASLNEGLSDGLTAEDAAVLDALRDPQPDPAVQQELDAAALEARYAVTGIWPKAPQIPPAPSELIELEDLYVTGIDPVSPALDAIALPGSASYLTDVSLPDIHSPPAPGTNFALDDSGRIVPTEEGALSPDGFTVFLGRPPVEPPTTRAQDAEPADIAPDTSGLALARPKARPTDLVEQNERATLGGLSRSELALLRPRLRPSAPQEAEEPQDADTPESVAEAVATESISPLAVAQSIRPATRPRNFNRIVARATRAAASAPQRVAAIAPRTVTPAIPSSASVTREATVRNVINLSRVNLIGVYGTPSNRRALVRLKNGRYQKVKVGDRFDGGRISAIGDSELRYQKGNRNVVLKMPNG